MKPDKRTYEEKITDWVVDNYCDPDDKNPNHSQFSAAQVTDIILEFNRQKLNGKFKL